MSYEVQLHCELLYHPLAVGEDSLPNSTLVLAESKRGVSDFRLTHYKRSDDSHLRDEQQLLYLTLNYQPTFKMLSSMLGLGTALRRLTSCLVT
ncbi:hypothetical protein TNCV_4500611 [Trichonephila clavipes]|nr:hypothetical protein TNCV_4500611 [Trichonephila clavipes]